MPDICGNGWTVSRHYAFPPLVGPLQPRGLAASWSPGRLMPCCPRAERDRQLALPPAASRLPGDVLSVRLVRHAMAIPAGGWEGSHCQRGPAAWVVCSASRAIGQPPEAPAGSSLCSAWPAVRQALPVPLIRRRSRMPPRRNGGFSWSGIQAVRAQPTPYAEWARSRA